MKERSRASQQKDKCKHETKNAESHQSANFQHSDDLLHVCFRATFILLLSCPAS